MKFFHVYAEEHYEDAGFFIGDYSSREEAIAAIDNHCATVPYAYVGDYFMIETMIVHATVKVTGTVDTIDYEKVERPAYFK